MLDCATVVILDQKERLTSRCRVPTDAVYFIFSVVVHEGWVLCGFCKQEPKGNYKNKEFHRLQTPTLLCY